jgi:hypothetical protein
MAWEKLQNSNWLIVEPTCVIVKTYKVMSPQVHKQRRIISPVWWFSEISLLYEAIKVLQLILNLIFTIMLFVQYLMSDFLNCLIFRDVECHLEKQKTRNESGRGRENVSVKWSSHLLCTFNKPHTFLIPDIYHWYIIYVFISILINSNTYKRTIK